MRLVVASLIAICIAPARVHASTVWNVKIAGTEGRPTQLTVLDGDPGIAFPSCACVAGVWRAAEDAGETATHFVGTLDALSFNHPRKARAPIRAKVRKTRALMGVHRDYRARLHGILRGSGQLVLREVAGGEWEVAGFADDTVGDLFAAHASWRAARRPQPSPPGAVVDPRADAAALAKQINDYRATRELPRIPVSPRLTRVAQAHVRDLNVNKPAKDGCNMHSWSPHGSWTACCYDSSKEAARCMWRKPREIAGYPGNGYEIAATASGITPDRALGLWQDSSAHHALVINTDQWKAPWRAFGVAIEGDYAVVWFGEQADKE